MRRLLLSFALLAVLLPAVRPPEARAQNTAPVARDDSISVEVTGPSIRIDVLANDTDADGDTLMIDSIKLQPTKGEININGNDESLQYLATTTSPGIDSLIYRVSDGKGGMDSALVKIFLIANDPPVAVDDTVSVFSHEVIDIDVLDNDTDPEDDSLRIVSPLVMEPLHGMATIVEDDDGQRLHYDPDDDYEGLDSLLYEITDPLGETDTAKVRIDVQFNQRPMAVDDEGTVRINLPLVIDVLDNDTDEEGDMLFISSIPEEPDNGTAEIIGEGTLIRYTPIPGFLGIDAFDYIVSDGVPRSSPQGSRATVSIEVIPPDGNFVASLSGAGVVPPVETRATGPIDASLDGNDLTFSGAFFGLESEVVSGTAGVVVQLGLAGQNGDLLFPLNVDLTQNMRGGTLTGENNTFTLSNEEVNALFTRRMYVNVLTEALPGGEIRGQLLPDGADDIFRAVFSGRAAVPANRSVALGGAVAERFDDVLVISGAFNGLESTFIRGGAGARLHQGFIGADGEVVRVLNVDLDEDRRGGTIEQADNPIFLTTEEIQLLESELMYIVIRTNNAREGEIRGQLLPLSKRAFEAALSGDNEVPPVPSAGFGGVIATIEGPTLTLGGTFTGLASGVDLTLRNGANVHEGAPNENGEILVDLLPLLESDRRSGMFLTGANQFTLSSLQVAALFDGQFYVNIHTDDTPEGEVRGQLLSSPNVPPIASSISSPADSAAVDLSGDPTTPFSVRWRTAPDPNGNTVYYRWQLARNPTFSAMIYASDLTTETALTTTFGDLGTAMTAAGISANATVTLYHRVVSTDGGLATVGPSSALTVTRGLLTALEDAAVPEHFAVLGNYPNPFNPVTTVHMDLPQAARVQVVVYDVLGRRVLVTPPQRLEAGARRAMTVDAGRLASGLYLYRVVALTDTEAFTGAGRMVVLK